MNYRKKLLLLLLIIAVGSIIYFTCGYYRNDRIHKNINMLKSPDQNKREKAIEELTEIGKPAVELLIFALGYDTAHLKSETMSILSAILPDNRVKKISGGIEEESANLKLGAITALGEIRDKRAIPSLISALKGKDKNQRHKASMALGKIGEPALPDLVKLLKNPDIEIKCLAIETLGQIKTEKSAEAVAEYLGYYEENITESASEALVNIGKPAKNVLINILRIYEGSDIRIRAIRIMGKIREPAFIEPLKETLGESNPDMVIEAATVLSQMNDRRAALALIEAISFNDIFIRKIVFKVIKENYNPQILTELQKRYREGNVKTRMFVVEILKEFYDPHSADFLISTLMDKKDSIREKAAWALGERVEVKAVKPLISLLKDKKPGVRRETALALEKIGDPAASPYLVKLLDDKSNWVRFSACEALENVGDPRDVKQLIKHLKSSDQCIKLRAVKSLYTLNDPSSFYALMEILRDKDRTTREIAGSAILEMASDKFTETLMVAAADRDYFTRCCAIKSLGIIGDKRAIDPIITATKSDDYFVRAAAAKALGMLGDDRVTVHLLPLLKDKKNDVQRQAIVALGRIGDRRAIPNIIQLIKTGEYLSEDEENGIGLILDKTHLKLLDKLETGTDEPIGENIWQIKQEIEKHERNSELMKKYQQSNDIEKKRILDSLKPICSNRIKKLLFEIVKKDNPPCKIRAMELIEWDDLKSQDILISLSKDSAPEVRKKAITLIGYYNIRRAVPLLIDNLKTEDFQIKLVSARTLGEMKDLRALHPLIEAYHNSPDIRLTIIEALIEIADPRAMDILIDNLLNQDEYKANAASYALKNIGKPTIPKLKRYMSKLNSEQRNKIEELTQQIESSTYKHEFYYKFPRFLFND